MSIKRKLAIYFSIFFTIILLATNALNYFSTRDMLIADQQKQMELLAKEISITIAQSQSGTQYIEDLIGERLRIVSVAIQNELDPDYEKVTDEELIALSEKMGVSHITLFAKDGEDIKGVKSSDPKERNLSSKEWGYWFTAFQQLFKNKNVSITEGQKLPHYWSGPMDVASSDPNHVDKWGYYYDGSTNYIINPYVRDAQIMEFKEKLVGPNAFINKTLQNNGIILSITGFNPKTFGKPPIYLEQGGKKFIPLEDREIQFGEYSYQQKEKDMQSITMAANTGRMSSYVATIDGKKVLKTFLPVNTTQPYVIGIVADYDFIQNVLDQQIVNQVFLSAVVLLVLYIVMYFFAGSIVQPVNQILQKVAQIAQGNFGVLVTIDRKDELGVLAEQVNIMSQNLKEYTQELERKKAEIEYHANYDFLTGLPNRRMFHFRIHKLFSDSERDSRPVSMMFIDLDRFKYINDMFGHSAGDYVLQTVAQRLSSCFSDEDLISRISGDEFVVAVPNGTMEKTDQMAQKVLEELGKPINYEGEELFITPSIGISLFPQDGEQVETILKNADTAMYRAKVQGKNNFQFYSAEMNEGKMRKSELEKGLRKALERNEFVLYYQPQVNLTTGEVIGTEALIRWNHPEFGMLAPSEFIPLAEETGLIVPIGEWVIRTACEQHKKWLNDGKTPMIVSVNLSATQFQHENLDEIIMKSLADTGLDPMYLKLEITESIAIYNEEYVFNKLHALKNAGIKIAIDDFGKGYSSLNYLKKFPIDAIKIDKSFIQDCTNDSDNAEIIKTIIAMARNLKVSVVAEGVETKQQLIFLKEQNCNEAQGFYFSKPLSAEQFNEYYEKQ